MAAPWMLPMATYATRPCCRCQHQARMFVGMPRSKRAAGKRGRPYHHGNLRRALLDEALVIVRAEGVEGLTLREIAPRLGVSRAALYRHFADKRALLTAVATEGFRALRQ